MHNPVPGLKSWPFYTYVGNVSPPITTIPRINIIKVFLSKLNCRKIMQIF